MAGALSPDGRRSQINGCIRTTVHHACVTAPTSSRSHDGATVATLRSEQEVDGVFACTRKERHTTRTGAPYLALELRDGSGAIAARAFREADALAGAFERGQLVRVRGRVARFRDQLQIDVQQIAPARGSDADPTLFLPRAYRDLDELEGFLEHLVREVYDPPLRQLLERMLADAELRAELRRAPCSVPGARAHGGHHAYLGGLLEHTVAVGTLALEACQLHPRLNRDLLLCAALVHDLGKTAEFTYGAEIGLSEEGRLLGHLVLGQQILDAHADDLAADRRLALSHCVLSHHGPRERIATPEALALYRLNALDASVKGALEHGLR
jgi:3'-5' exoribonuclease